MKIMHKKKTNENSKHRLRSNHLDSDPVDKYLACFCFLNGLVQNIVE